MPYDFKAARKLRNDLVHAYRTLKHLYPDDGTWSWWITSQINEIDREMQEAHQDQSTVVLLIH